MLALTATAAPPVRADMLDRLGLDDPVEVIGSFDRPNLHLAAALHVDEDQRRAAVVDRAAALAEENRGRGLVYCAARAETGRLAEALRRRGIAAEAYHAGLGRARREAVHDRFSSGATAVVVATSAFGMGIDQPDVRFVLHAASPGSLDDYYQQVGRAGRDGEPAVVELHHHARDSALQRFLSARRPKPDSLRAALEAVADGARSLPDVVRASGLSRVRATTALNLLEQAGAVVTDEDGLLHRTEIDADAAVKEAVDHAEGRREVIVSRVERMRLYAETTDCRRRLLLGYFGEQHPQRCGRCDNCDDGTATDVEAPAGAIDTDAGRAVVHPKFGDGVVMAEDDDRVTVFFHEYGYRDLATEAVREHDLLRPAEADEPSTDHVRDDRRGEHHQGQAAARVRRAAHQVQARHRATGWPVAAARPAARARPCRRSRRPGRRSPRSRSAGVRTSRQRRPVADVGAAVGEPCRTRSA